ncbi:NAD(P)H-binding protein [Limosilactobacillus sp. STM2_1]|uniref:NAD(P)H-binding protein n=1 Tax=Limosilactobacillus rudii TaxID=2759755 RepID=A0A7W3UMR5_9LACO|nr:NAD(P)H-binding protein [Limosilactobacillus rudii]MBB1079780.1 NAD(P)H-binding protein [Limosilactobacillus rudii]MBB1097760.1 NAD(P)H-binding protein [Limosilactobacillus rudii]MCD7134841.1 NAD(P)H-binding protein [Limosilactobacillus rudii]
MKYGVTVATGKFGRTAVKELVKVVAPNNVVVIVRNAEKARKVLPAGIEIRQADYGDENSLSAALKGIDKLLFISSLPGGPVSRETQHRNIVTAAIQNKVKFIAYTSFPHANTAENELASDHKITEKLIRDSGIAHSFLRNNWYIENDLDAIKTGAAGLPVYYWANNRAGWALEREYAEGAVKVLLTDQPKEVYEFAGPSRTYEQFFATVQQATGKDFNIKQVSEAQYIKYLESNGLNPEVAAMVASFQAPIDDGSLTEETNDLADILGGLTSLNKAIIEVLNK